MKNTLKILKTYNCSLGEVTVLKATEKVALIHSKREFIKCVNYWFTENDRLEWGSGHYFNSLDAALQSFNEKI